VNKAIMLVLDGAADRPAPELGGKTPLEAARTPHLDSLAALGATGVHYALGHFIAPSTDHAHFVMLGYPYDSYPGRGYVEALAHSIDLEPEDVVLRDLFVTTSREGERWIIEREAVEFTESECEKLSANLPPFAYEGIAFEHVYTGKRHGFLIMREAGTTDFSDTDPFASGLPVLMPQALEGAASPAAARWAAAGLAAWTRHAHRALSSHPVNDARRARGLPPLDTIVAKWPGMARPILSFYELTGFRAAIVATSRLFEGIARLLATDYVAVEPGLEPHAEGRALVEYGIRALESHDFVLVHTKLPDEAGHKKDPETKARILEDLDAGLLALLDCALDGSTAIIVTADHGTPSSGTLLHSGDPAPLAVVSEAFAPDQVTSFTERTACKGSLGPLSGADIMPLILHCTNRSRYRGSRPYPQDRPARATVDRVAFLDLEG
jgi:2,3-bisphosphoglycerate-independent phosphoglycerate mutase